MIVVTTENLKGYKVVEVKGQAFGLIVRSRGIGGNVVAGLRSIVGGEIHEYTQMLEDARKQAIDRLVKNAAAMGGNAVVMMRFDDQSAYFVIFRDDLPIRMITDHMAIPLKRFVNRHETFRPGCPICEFALWFAGILNIKLLCWMNPVI